jgi:hypothetical protein
MRGFMLVCLAATVGCASGTTSGGGGGVSTTTLPQTVRVATGTSTNMTASMMNSTSANGGAVAFPEDRVWAVMRAVYDSLGIPVATFEAASKTIGNNGLRLKRRLGEVALSKYVNCGSTQGFPSADTYEVFLSVMTSVRPAAVGPQATQISTTVEGQARPITFSGEPVRCSSLSTLESRIVEVANKLLK